MDRAQNNRNAVTHFCSVGPTPERTMQIIKSYTEWFSISISVTDDRSRSDFSSHTHHDDRPKKRVERNYHRPKSQTTSHKQFLYVNNHHDVVSMVLMHRCVLTNHRRTQVAGKPFRPIGRRVHASFSVRQHTEPVCACVRVCMSTRVACEFFAQDHCVLGCGMRFSHTR